MEFDIYDIETKEIEIDILKNVKYHLYDVMLHKIRSNSNAYLELDNLINKLDKKELICENIIKEKIVSSKNNISNLKIETTVVKDLLLLKKELECKYIYEVVIQLIKYYKHEKYLINLSKIETCQISKSLKKNLINSKFNICVNKKFDNKIVYPFDDIVINDDIEYLDIRKFKMYSRNNSESYLFSPNFTLVDLDDFFDILFE